MDSTGDGADSATSDGICDDGSGNCTLRAAIQQANEGNGAVIKFNISGSGTQTISPASALPTITMPVFIDGYTQSGASAGTGTNGLTLSGKGSHVRGLAINSFDGNGIVLQGSGGRQVLVGNRIGTDTGGVSEEGNGAAGVYINGAPDVVLQENVISGNETYGVHISGSSAKRAVLQGNTIGLNGAGSADLGNTLAGVYVNGAEQATLRDNVISGNDSHGVSLSGSGAHNADIQYNLIGVNASGTVDLGNTGSGIHISGARNTGIYENVIGGNDSHGISLTSSGTMDTYIGENYIGTNESESDLGNGGSGVHIASSANNNFIEANTIANNTGDGVTVTSTASGVGNIIRKNSMHSNDGLGIDLGDDGATANDTGDVDTGPNFLQNFPTNITLATRDDVASVSFTLEVTLSRGYIVDFYSCDTSSSGEGKRWLGSTGARGSASGERTFTASTFLGQIGDFTAPTATDITATATDTLLNATSEFAPCVALVDLPELDLSVDSMEVTEDASPSATYAIALASEPSDATRVKLVVLFSSRSNIVNPTTGYPYTLVFTTMNWDDPISITVFGVSDDDALHEANEIHHLVPNGGSDHIAAIMPVEVTDDEAPTLILESTTTGVTFPSDVSVGHNYDGIFLLNEGDTATYTVKLEEEPDGDVTVDTNYAAGDAWSVSPASITFTKAGEASDADKWEWDDPPDSHHNGPERPGSRQRVSSSQTRGYRGRRGLRRGRAGSRNSRTGSAESDF